MMMKLTPKILVGLMLSCGLSQTVMAETIAASNTAARDSQATPAANVKQSVTNDAKIEEADLHFEIRQYILDGATLLSGDEIAETVAPYIGKNKDFSDIERALEAIEAIYAQKGFTAIHVLLPEQKISQGEIHFHVIESRFGKVIVKNNKLIKYTTEQNALNAIPAVRPGNIPVPKLIASELKLANENPARQLNVVLKASDTDDEIDANIIVTDTKPGAWGVNYDNSGTPETGRSRLGLSYRYANVFDKDQVASFQTQVSPGYMDRVKVFNGSYKIPFYSAGDSAEIAASYSNVNSLVGGLSNFNGGGEIISYRYNHPLDKVGSFDPKLVYGFDYRDFKAVEETTPPVTVMYNEIVVTPVIMSLNAQGKLGAADVVLNASVAVNLPGINKGRAADFAQYDLVTGNIPNSNYHVVRYGASYVLPMQGDWQFHTTFNGQWSSNLLIQGEQIRLGGMDAVRGFSEGSEGGDSGIRGSVEFYSPAFQPLKVNCRALVFYDAGQASTNVGDNVAISSYGVGLRSTYSNDLSLRMDAGRILKEGTDPQQQKGDSRVHLVLSATF